MNFSYTKAMTVNAALDCLGKGDARIIAGGTDLLVEIQEKKISDISVVDINNIEDFNKIREEAGRIYVGACVTHAELCASDIILKKAPLLLAAASVVGSPQIRSRGTIGGNVVTASPAGDTIPALFCLNAVFIIAGMNGSRKVSAEKFFLGPKKCDIQKGELLAGIELDAAKDDEFFWYKKLGQRKSLAISKVTAAIRVEIANGIINSARIALGAVGPVVLRAGQAEKFLTKKNLNEEVIKQASMLVRKDSAAINDIRSESEYRNEMTRVLTERGLSEIMESTKRR